MRWKYLAGGYAEGLDHALEEAQRTVGKHHPKHAAFEIRVSEYGWSVRGQPRPKRSQVLDTKRNRM